MAKIYYRKRSFQGLSIAARILLSYKLACISSVFRSRQQNAVRLKKLHRNNAILIRVKALEMKGIMIKVGQFLSSRKDFLPDEYTEELAGLQDQVPPHDYAEIRQRIIEELGSPPEQLFSEFEKEPIASASLGQVHRAVLKDGREAAVKIQYPGIDKIIETDIKIFEILTSFLRGRLGWIDLRVLHEEFSKTVRAELDYVQEGRNAERFRLNFRGDPRIVIPKIYWDFSNRKVLTLEFVRGIKITECAVVKASGVDCRILVNLLAETYVKMIFVHGFFHCDPHPGNLLVDRAGRVAIVDFGMHEAIEPEIMEGVRMNVLAAVTRNETDRRVGARRGVRRRASPPRQGAAHRRAW